MMHLHVMMLTVKKNQHGAELHSLYENILESLPVSSSSLPLLYKAKPGWKLYAEEAWVESGRQRFGPLFDHKKHTNVKFKFASRFIKRNEAAVRADSLTKILEVNSVNDFWKEIKRINSVKTSLPAKTGGVSGSDETLL